MDLWGEYFIPSLTLLVNFKDESKEMCLPWEDIERGGYVEPIYYIGEWLETKAHEYKEGRGRGPPHAFVHRFFPASNNVLHASPFLVPVLRLRRLQRPEFYER
jgi:hypothetical protein